VVFKYEFPDCPGGVVPYIVRDEVYFYSHSPRDEPETELIPGREYSVNLIPIFVEVFGRYVVPSNDYSIFGKPVMFRVSDRAVVFSLTTGRVEFCNAKGKA
jgi:hypothetical protein